MNFAVKSAFKKRKVCVKAEIQRRDGTSIRFNRGPGEKYHEPLTSSSTQMDHTQPPADQSSAYDPVKPSTFVAPAPGIPSSVIIEFCDRVSP